MRIWLLIANPFKISLNTLKNLFGFALAIFALKPFVGILCAFFVIAAIFPVTQWNNIFGYCPGTIRFTEGYPVVSSYSVSTKQVVQLPTTYSTTIMMVFKTSYPLFMRKGIWQLALTSAAATFSHCMFLRIQPLPLATSFCIFLAICLFVSALIYSGAFGISLIPQRRGYGCYLAVTRFAPRKQAIQPILFLVEILRSCREFLFAFTANLGWGIIFHSSESSFLGEPLGMSVPRTASIFPSIIAHLPYDENYTLSIRGWV